MISCSIVILAVMMTVVVVYENLWCVIIMWKNGNNDLYLCVDKMMYLRRTL